MSFLCRFNTDLGSHLPEGFIIVSERFFFFFGKSSLAESHPDFLSLEVSGLEASCDLALAPRLLCSFHLFPGSQGPH